MPGTIARPVALITGACGGMGRACCRALGVSMSLLLTDINEERLGAFSKELEEEGYEVAGSVAGSLLDRATLEKLRDLQTAAGSLGALVHTAGLSPTMAGWRAIMDINLIGTEMLLAAFERSLTSGTVAVLIASLAAYECPKLEELDAVLSAPLAADFHERLEPLLKKIVRPGDSQGMSTAAYFASKREVVRIAERRAPSWAEHGARIVSISPGTIWTPMLRTELETNPAANRVLDLTPLKRWGTPMDIAQAARFLVSAEASFITGCDLRVDGGVAPALGGPLH